MFQSFKRKTIGRKAARQQPVSAEFETQRNNLQNIQKALSSALGDIDGAEKQWKAIAKSADTFATALHSLYPIDDEVRTLFKTTVDQVQGEFPTQLEQAGQATSKVRTIERMVRAYLTEIKTLSSEYSKVDNARRDYAMYQSKVDKLAKKTAGSDKQSTHLDKLEESKAQYNSILDATVHRMKTTYDKAPTMFRAAFVAYWLYQSLAHEIVTKHCGPAEKYANDNADHLFQQSESASHIPTPESAAPESAAPESAAPESAAPESAAPESAAPAAPEPAK